jgi:hypothetical protein
MIKIYTVIRWIPAQIMGPVNPINTLILLIFLGGFPVGVNHGSTFGPIGHR